MSNKPMRHAVFAGLAYFAVVFAAGFVLGTLRVLVIVPRLGEAVAVILELPLILAISWIVCRRLIAHFAIEPALGARLAMGAVAFACLMMAEFGVASLAFGRSLGEHISTYRHGLALLGLAGQVVFAAMPAMQIARR